MSPERGLRLRLATTARRFSAAGMNPGRSGNFSVRVERGFVVTPSGAPYDTLHPDDLVFVGENGAHGGGQRNQPEAASDSLERRPARHAAVVRVRHRRQSKKLNSLAPNST